MKKKLILLLYVLCITVSAGCSGKNTATGNEKISDAVYNDDSVSLAEYKGLKAEKKRYTITQQAMDDAVKEELEDYIEYKSVKRASKTGDDVYADYTASADGDIIDQEEEYCFTIGDEDFGPAFDEKLTGVSVGDTFSFTLDYDREFPYDVFAGKTVQFEVTIREVQTEIMPELTDQFIKENLGYDSYEIFQQSVHDSLEQQYEAESTDNLQEELLQQVIEASSILQYSKEEYEEATENVNSFYAEYADMFQQDIEDIYETFDVTKESLEDEIMEELYRMIVVKAIINSEKLTLSDAEYEEGIVYYMAQNDYTSKDEFVSDYGEEEIQNRLLEDKVLELLEDSAEITEVEAEYEE